MTYTFFCKDDVKMVYALESKGDAIMGAILINFPEFALYLDSK